jgi:hypothetical protein
MSFPQIALLKTIDIVLGPKYLVAQGSRKTNLMKCM